MQMVWKISWNSPGHAAPGRRNSRNGEGLAEPLSWSPGGDQPWDPPPHPPAQGIPPSPGNALGMPWECLGMGGLCCWDGFPPNPWIPLPRDVNRVRLSQTPHSHPQPSLEIPGTEIQTGRGGINMGWSGLRSETPTEPRDEGNRAGGIPSTSQDRAGSCLNPLRAGRGAGSGGRRC